MLLKIPTSFKVSSSSIIISTPADDIIVLGNNRFIDVIHVSGPQTIPDKERGTTCRCHCQGITSAVYERSWEFGDKAVHHTKYKNASSATSRVSVYSLNIDFDQQ